MSDYVSSEIKTSSVTQPPSTWLGQLYFSTMSHHLYDLGLYRLVSPFIWRCPTQQLMDNYVENISPNHLEIGVGSGYFLTQTLCEDFLRRLVLLDLNSRCLEKSVKRLREFAPCKLQQNILMPFDQAQVKHSSVGMNYVLHCIPGSFRTNQRIFAHVHSVLEDGGVFFGATLLPHPVRDNFVSWLFMKLLNAVGIFRNAEHCLADLQHTLESTFRDVELSVVGSAAIFRAVK